MATDEDRRYVWDSDGVPYQVELRGMATEPPVLPLLMSSPIVGSVDLTGTVMPAVPPAIPPVPDSPFQALHFYLEGEEAPRYVTAFDIPRERSLSDFSDEELLTKLEEAKLLARGLGFGSDDPEPRMRRGEAGTP